MVIPLDRMEIMKKVLRGLLISEKRQGMPMRTLQRNYRDIEGRPIPLFGYPDTAALLNSLTDTVYMVSTIKICSFVYFKRILPFYCLRNSSDVSLFSIV